MTTAIITFSFDDGDPLDLEIARRLKKYDLQATFYVPISNIEGRRTLEPCQVVELKEMGFEIGTHGYHHHYLDSIPAAMVHGEIKSGRDRLEQVLGQAVSCFCYPGGRTPPAAIAAVRELGFAYARTTRECRFSVENPLLAPTTNHLGRHTRRHYFKEALLSCDSVYIRRFLFNRLWSLDWLEFTRTNIDYAVKTGGICHLWGHAFEINRDNDWERLEMLFSLIHTLRSEGQIVLRTNSESRDATL